MVGVKKQLLPWSIAAVVILCISILWSLSLFQPLEWKWYDSSLIQVTRNEPVADDAIVIFEVDQFSIDEATRRYGWGWPWPREAWARMIDYAAECGSGPVVIDIMFTEPSVFGPQDDAAFAEAIKNHGQVTINQMKEAGASGETQLPLQIFMDSAAVVAECASHADADGVNRGIPVTSNGTVTLPFAPIVVQEGWDAVAELEQKLPAREDGTVLLRYKGPIGRYQPYTAELLLDCIDAKAAGEEPILVSEDLQGKYIYFIYYAPGLFDICTTPVGTTYPGSGIAITAMDNLLQDEFITPVPRIVILTLIIIFGMLAVWAAISVASINTTRKTILFGSIFFVTGPVVLLAVSYLLLKICIWLPPVAIMISYTSAYLAVTFYSYVTEGRQKRFIKTAFSQYLSEHVINNLLEDPSQLQLGGEKRNITVFFSDIKGFTSIGEQLPPETLTEVLNVYLTELSTIIMESGGTIDKYVGDAIVAFWNAPATIEGHASKALMAALQCQEQVVGMVERLQPVIMEPLYTRIGINTGESIVGNMGSRNRFNYTMFGDVVNTGSRLEGLNKQFGTYVLCTGSTKEQAEAYGTITRFREIGRVLVVGKTEPVTVYEPMSPKRWDREQQTLERFTAALKLFYEGNLEAAAADFSAIAAETRDAPSACYASRCRELLEKAKENPAVLENWQGIWVAATK